MKRLLLTLILAVLFLSGTFASLDRAAAQGGYNTACYGEQGGSKHVAGSGCEYEFQAGSTLDVDGTADFSGATVTGITTSTLDVQTTGALTVTGATILSGTVTANSALDMGGNAISNIGAAGTDFSATGGLTLADDLNMSNQPAVNIGAAGTDFGTDGGLTLAAGLTVTAGDTDLGGGLNYGADDLYPLGYGSADQQVVCGTTELTGTAEIEATGLTTVTYVIATQVTDPAATAAFLTASDPTTSTFILSSWEADYDAGSTPVSAHWCAIGDQ